MKYTNKVGANFALLLLTVVRKPLQTWSRFYLQQHRHHHRHHHHHRQHITNLGRHLFSTAATPYFHDDITCKDRWRRHGSQDVHIRSHIFHSPVLCGGILHLFAHYILFCGRPWYLDRGWDFLPLTLCCVFCPSLVVFSHNSVNFKYRLCHFTSSNISILFYFCSIRSFKLDLIFQMRDFVVYFFSETIETDISCTFDTDQTLQFFTLTFFWGSRHRTSAPYRKSIMLFVVIFFLKYYIVSLDDHGWPSVHQERAKSGEQGKL